MSAKLVSRLVFDDRIEYHLPNGYFHNEDGPAISYHNGTKIWCINGHIFRLDGHCVEYPSYKIWCIAHKTFYSSDEFKLYRILINHIGNKAL